MKNNKSDRAQVFKLLYRIINTFFSNRVTNVADIIMDVVAGGNGGFESLVVRIFVVSINVIRIFCVPIETQETSAFAFLHLLECSL